MERDFSLRGFTSQHSTNPLFAVLFIAEKTKDQRVCDLSRVTKVSVVESKLYVTLPSALGYFP